MQSSAAETHVFGRYAHVLYLIFAVGLCVTLSHARPVLAACGDGIVTGGEECDPGGGLFIDGNPNNASCTTGGSCFYEGSCCKFNCQFVGQGAPCFDGNLCTVNDTCDQVGLCNSGTNATGGSACEDGLFCTANDQCDTNGVCIGGADPCTGNPECQDTCNEAADNCLSLGGTACGSPVSNQCNGADTCDGAGTCQANLAGPGTPAPVLCNDTNECTDDVCDGAGTCSNPNVAMGTACGDPTDSECANPDSCDGAGACLDNDEAPGDACGDPSDTDCTNPDTCDLAGDCVANDETPGTACGNPSDDECNGADTCDGAGTCEANVSAPGVPAPTTCADGNECTADLCDGAGGCTNPDEAPGTACGDATALPCNQADSCDGLGACLANLLPDATPCDDNDACTLFDACDGGVCTPTDAVECDDGILCTYDTCDPMSGNCVFIDAPAPSCHAAPLAQLKIVDKEDDTHDKLKWKWVKGEETLFSELGTPDTTTTYEFCLYDSVGGVSTLVASMTIPPSSKWRAKNDKLYKYKDRTASAGGISKIKARALPSPTMGVKAQGLNFPTPMPFSLEEFFDQDPMVSAQLVTDEGQCWAADFTEARRNTGNRFIAKRLGIIIK